MYMCVCVCLCAARHWVATERNCGGDLDVLSFVRICLWKWVGRVNRMDSNRRVSQEFNKNSQRSRIRGWPRNRRNCVKQMLTDEKLQIGKSSKKNRADWEKCIEEAKVRIGL